MSKLIIYKITNLINNKAYVGQTIRGLDKRIKQYKSNLGGGQYALKNAFNKYGFDNFLFEELFICFDKHDLNYFEKYFINSLDSLYPNGYNLTTGGDSNFNFTEQTIAKMSKAKKGKPTWNKGKKGSIPWNKGKKGFITQSQESNLKRSRFGAENHFYNKKHSLKTIQKISLKKKGSIPHNLNTNKICKVKGSISCIYEDIRDLSKEGFNSSCILRCCRNERKSHLGFNFQFYKESYVTEIAR